jgi:Protein of Unknown function (DUF2784)
MVLYHVLADIVVVFHAGYVAFVIFGFAAILIGSTLGWRWVRNFYFRAAHLAAIGLVCVEAVVGMMCPLTTLEDWLRIRGGDTPYPGDFIGYWAHRLIFYQAPMWVFTTAYLIFGALVVAVFILAPPQLPYRRGHRSTDSNSTLAKTGFLP